MVLCAFVSASCNSRQKQAQAANTDITTDNPKVEKAKEDIVGYIKDLYVAEYAKELEAHCKSLLRSYQAFGAQQTAFQKQTHDVLNAQFTYHALIEQGKTEEAEQYRNQKQKEWRQES